MAKKQSLSYSPNMGLIAGEAAVAGSEAARTSLGGQAFTQNLSASVIGMIDEDKKRKAEMQGWMTDLGSVDNINKLDQNYNKQAVTDFVRGGRDEFAKLAAIYKKTGNLDVMDKMNDIKYSFQNLNSQLENLQQDRKTYIDQFNKGKIVTIKGDEKYTDIYTNKGQFKIEKNGDIGFSHGENGSVYSKFNDIAGKWNPDNSIYGKEFLTTDSQEVARAQKGDRFDARGVRNRLGGLLNQQSWQEVQVAFMQDIIGDDEMELEDGRTAGNMSFQALWSTGQLDKKFYEGFKAESDGTYNTDWMFEKENRSLGTKLKAMYDTDVIESRHEEMFIAKKGKIEENKEESKNPYGLSLSSKGKYGLGFPSKGTKYSVQYDVGYVTNKIDNLKNGSEIAFQGGSYTFREVDGKTQWWQNYGYNEAGDKVEGVGIGKPIGTAKDMARDVFNVDDPIFTDIVTEREAEVPDDKTGLLPSQNQFSDPATGKISVVPSTFIKSVGKDNEDVVKYLRAMNIKGLKVGIGEVGKELSFPGGKPSNAEQDRSPSGYDDVYISLNGKLKMFVVDPNIKSDDVRASEIWEWLYNASNIGSNQIEKSNIEEKAEELVQKYTK